MRLLASLTKSDALSPGAGCGLSGAAGNVAHDKGVTLGQPAN